MSSFRVTVRPTVAPSFVNSPSSPTPYSTFPSTVALDASRDLAARLDHDVPGKGREVPLDSSTHDHRPAERGEILRHGLAVLDQDLPPATLFGGRDRNVRKRLQGQPHDVLRSIL
jgi:hypothetical protein